jgi:hypothetical protein
MEQRGIVSTGCRIDALAWGKFLCTCFIGGWPSGLSGGGTNLSPESCLQLNISWNKQTPWRTVPTKTPPPVAEVSANYCG